MSVETLDVEIEYDVTTGRLVYRGPSEDLDKLLEMFDKAGLSYHHQDGLLIPDGEDQK